MYSPKKYLCLLAMLLTVITASAVRSCPTAKMQVERLPDMNIPRSGHQAFMLDGVLYVIGGHTSGFVPTSTAEYFEDGEWHVLNMVYSHDHGLCLPLRSGKVLIAGGHQQPLGIGQTYTLELFDPVTRTFDGYGCLDKKRFFPSVAELANGKVIISGNSYHPDGIECFDGTRQNKFVKDVSQYRSLPYIFPVADDNALIFGCNDEHQKLSPDTVKVDQLNGDTLHIPLFDEWFPLSDLWPHPCTNSYIGDETHQYAYLLAVVNKKSGQVAFACIEGTDIQLLPTTDSIPMQCEHGPIEWQSSVIADRQAHRAYMMGRDNRFHLYVLAVDYDKQPAPLTFYYSELQDSLPNYTPVLTPEGDLLLAGGITDNNFMPFATLFRFRLGQHDEPVSAITGVKSWQLVVILAFVATLIIMAVILIRLRHRHRQHKEELAPVSPHPVPQDETTPLPEEETTEIADFIENETLLSSISQLMEVQKVYLNSELKVADVAQALNVSSRAVSDCIKAANGQSFTQFVNAYRIEHAKRLLHANTDMKVSAAALQSGFATEMSFFRSFKSLVGMTPREWVEQQGQIT